MADKPIAESDLPGWPRISQALETIQTVQGVKAFAAIVQRLADGLIRAVAAEGFVGSKPTPAPVIIPKAIWESVNEWQYLSTQSFWTTDDLEVEVQNPGNYYNKTR